MEENKVGEGFEKPDYEKKIKALEEEIKRKDEEIKQLKKRNKVLFKTAVKNTKSKVEIEKEL